MHELSSTSETISSGSEQTGLRSIVALNFKRIQARAARFPGAAARLLPFRQRLAQPEAQPQGIIGPWLRRMVPGFKSTSDMVVDARPPEPVRHMVRLLPAQVGAGAERLSVPFSVSLQCIMCRTEDISEEEGVLCHAREPAPRHFCCLDCFDGLVRYKCKPENLPALQQDQGHIYCVAAPTCICKHPEVNLAFDLYDLARSIQRETFLLYVAARCGQLSLTSRTMSFHLRDPRIASQRWFGRGQIGPEDPGGAHTPVRGPEAAGGRAGAQDCSPSPFQ